VQARGYIFHRFFTDTLSILTFCSLTSCYDSIGPGGLLNNGDNVVCADSLAGSYGSPFLVIKPYKTYFKLLPVS
jgi:hypothetical protein